MTLSYGHSPEAPPKTRKLRVLVCADGTCNAFGSAESNVAKLLRHVQLGSHESLGHASEKQVAAYDQGLGTWSGQNQASLEFQQTVEPKTALDVLAPPRESLRCPWTWPSWLLSMTAGTGLRDNVQQLYEWLSQQHEPGCDVFLFGFSRGAFTVRALAAFTWRFGVPVDRDRDSAARCFKTRWPELVSEYQGRHCDDAAWVTEPALAPGMQACAIHFMGLWDTVKSYGGIRPVMLPHLRHNPSVHCVRHAMALNEYRAWYENTTWGWLDMDRKLCGAVDCPNTQHKVTSCTSAACHIKPGSPRQRLSPEIVEKLDRRDIREVWFRGSHSDIGGGNGNTATSDITLRWILGEARHFGLKLNPEGEKLLGQSDADPVVKDPRRSPLGMVWYLPAYLPRWTISNEGLWPRLVPAKLGWHPREPSKSVRSAKVWVHESVPLGAGGLADTSVESLKGLPLELEATDRRG